MLNMPGVIGPFRGPHWIYSNFDMSTPITVGRRTWKSVEHFYNANKVKDISEIKMIFDAKTPGDTKRLARRFKIRDDWNFIRNFVMVYAVGTKINQHKRFLDALMSTDKQIIVELNQHHDNYWGECTCQSCQLKNPQGGTNALGTICMYFRDGVFSRDVSPLEKYIDPIFF